MTTPKGGLIPILRILDTTTGAAQERIFDIQPPFCPKCRKHGIIFSVQVICPNDEDMFAEPKRPMGFDTRKPKRRRGTPVTERPPADAVSHMTVSTEAE